MFLPVALPASVVNNKGLIAEARKKDVGVNFLSLIPYSGSRIALSQDKQRKPAHAIGYYMDMRNSPDGDVDMKI